MTSERPRRKRTPPAAGDTYAQLGERIREARQARGLTQAALGAPYFTRSFVSAIEHGKPGVSIKALRHFAKTLGLSVRELIPPDF